MTHLYQPTFGANAVILCKAAASDYIIYCNVVVPEHLHVDILLKLYFTVRTLLIFKTKHICRIVIFDFDFRIVKMAL